MQINKQTFLAGLSCILSVAILTVTIPIAFKGEKEMATIITIANGDAGSVVRGAINDNFDEVNTELEADTTAIGTLASLNTTAKSNLVAAINEVISDKPEIGYGEMYRGDTNATLSLPAKNTNYQVIDLSTGEVSGMTFASNTLTVTNAGKYLINYSISIYPDDTMITQSVYGVILLNNVASAKGECRVHLSTGKNIVVSSTAILDISAGQTLKLAFFRKSDFAPTSIIINEVNFTAVRLN